jgi:putative transposase
MKYNREIHRRRSVRLRGYDYAKEGMFFVTICCQDRIHFFGEVENKEMQLNDFGKIAHDEWEKLPERWPHIALGAYQIMPNHMHGVLLINHPSIPDDLFTAIHSEYLKEHGSSFVPGKIHFSKFQWDTRPYIGQIIGAYKSIVSTACLKLHKEKHPDVWLDKIWQRSFDDRIIRSAEAFEKISHYIIKNPAKWVEDEFFN